LPLLVAAEAKLADLLDDLVCQLQAGQAVDVETLIEAHPQHAAELRRLLPAMPALADLDHSGSDQASGKASSGVPLGALDGFHILREEALDHVQFRRSRQCNRTPTSSRCQTERKK
jgi:hypothetical protein